MRRAFGLLLFSCVAVAFPAFAQNFDMQRDHLPLAELKGQFRFHTGDDPDGKLGWANPAFDDSGWPLLRSDKSWSDQGYNHYSGFVWFRFRVTVPDGQNDLAIFIPLLRDSYVVYADGRLIGQIGGFPPHPKVIVAPHELFVISRSLIPAGQPLVLAVRAWLWPPFAVYPNGGFLSPPVVGDAAAVARWRDLQIHDTFWSQTGIETEVAVSILAALLGLALFLVRPSDREYFWYFAAQVFWSISTVASAAVFFLRTPIIIGYVSWSLGSCAGAFLNLVFFHALLRQRKRVLFWLGSVPILLLFPLMCAAPAGWVSFPRASQAQSWCFVLYTIAVALLIYRSGRKGNSEAWLLIVPFTLSCLNFASLCVFYAFELWRYPAFAAFNQRLQHLVTWPVQMATGSILSLACNSAVCGVLILRFASSRRDEERLSAELEAARVVQQVLIPNQVPTVPGYQIQSVYKPAGQVGGDFFQILPTANGGVLAVIGDVSGKGLPAAMTVSLLVGTARTLARSIDAPGQILEAMNQEMLGRSQGGFTTCLVARADSDGRLTLANAGHLAPYLDGREVELESGLPLGISANAAYLETTVRLEAGSQLTLLTDGVVEARSAAGELFGFERTAKIAHSPAESIARVAREFGQDDDITVLTLSLAPAGVLA